MAVDLKTAFETFARQAAPVLSIHDERYYGIALELVDELLEDLEEESDMAMNALIGVLAKSIAAYESRNGPTVVAGELALDDPPDVAMLRLLMDQHGLGVADFPEIGDKSLVSRILSGSRNLTKQHIVKLSKRFGVEPGSFFD